MLQWQIGSVTQHEVGIVINKQGKILAKRIHVHIGHTKQSKTWDQFLKCMKENNPNKKEAKEQDSWIQLKSQPALPAEAHFVITSKKEPQLLEPISSE